MFRGFIAFSQLTIVFRFSIAGHKVANQDIRQFYSATKHMVTALTKGLRISLQPKNIRVTVSRVSLGGYYIATAWWLENVFHFMFSGYVLRIFQKSIQCISYMQLLGAEKTKLKQIDMN